jgi:multimeric flavodoxin WrbA
MKTVILFGSPRKSGNTRQLVDAFTGGMKKGRHEAKLLYLNEMKIRPCQGCLSCAETGACRIKDDMKDVRESIMESDVIVYATPVYWWAPSAQLKAVMDRSIAFLDEQMNSRIKGKRAVSLVCCADSDKGTCGPILEIFKRSFEGLGMEYSGHVEALGCEEKGTVGKKALDAAGSLGKGLFS